MANPNIDREKAIRTLLDADLSGDRAACKRAGIDERTLRRWRTRLASDPELTEAYRKKNAAADRSWKAARRETLGNAIRAIDARVAKGNATMGELIAAIKTLGELEITQEALGSSLDDHPDPRPAEGEGGAGAGTPRAQRTP